MKTYNAGQKVKYGLYVAPGALDMRFVGADDEALEGKREAKYFRLPTVLMIAAAPILGGLFVMAFPVIVLVMAAAAMVKLVIQTVTGAVASRAHLVSMQWEPSAAYLNKQGKKGQKKDKPEELKKLEGEVQDRRKDEK